MKKKSGLVLALFIALSLTACGKGADGNAAAPDRNDAPLEREDSSSKTSESSETKTDVSTQGGEETVTSNDGTSSVSEIQSATDVVWGKQDDISREEIIEDAAADGMEVSFGDDGSMTVVDADGNVFVQNTDGSWASTDEDGMTSQLGGSWPDNEFTRLVPRPEFEMAGSSYSDDEFNAAFQGVSVEQVREYASKVKGKGFTIDAEEQDQEVYGIVIYIYSAYNEDGYQAEITFSGGTCGVMIRK